MKYLKDLPLQEIKGKRVVLRVDYNVPILPNGKIADDTRIRLSLKTIKYLLQSGAKVILVSHLGRPVVRNKEKIERIINGNKNLIMAPIAQRLCNWLKIKSKPRHINLKQIVLPAYELRSDLMLLENIRFDSREEKNDPIFTKELSSLADIYVNDAFAVSHREHASIVGITKLLPSYAGFLVQKEIDNLNKLMEKSTRPMLFILGGAKVYDKMMVIKNLLKITDQFLLGGVMANTFMKARNINVDRSVVENDRVELANNLFRKAARKFILPTTLVWDKGRIVDIDPAAVKSWKRYFDKAKTIFWNGTMGLTSLGVHKFARGSEEIAKLMADSKAVTIVSGGDTIAVVNKLKLLGKMTFVSTGGGATLQYLAGEKLPGLEALK